MSEQSSVVGRPRPTEVVERDDAVLKLVPKDGITKNELATQLGVSPSHAYLSLFRLRRDGKVTQGTDANRGRWFPA